MAFLDTAENIGTAANATYHQEYAIKAFYEKTLIKNLRGMEVMSKYAMKKSIPGNLSKTIEFTRVGDLGKQSAVTEGENPSAISPTVYKVTATLAEYAAVSKMSALWSQTTFEEGKGFVEAHKRAMVLTKEWLLMKAVVEGAASGLFGNGVAALGSLAYTDVLHAGDIADACTVLRQANATPLNNGYFGMAMPPSIHQSLIEESSSPIVASYAGESGDAIRKNAVYNYFGVEFLVDTLDCYYTNNAGTQGAPTAGAVGASYYNLCHMPVFGKDTFAEVSLDSGGVSPYNGMKYGQIMMVTQPDSYNPTLAYISMGWRFPMAVAVLQSAGIVTVAAPDPTYATS